MCGIAGILKTDSVAADRGLLGRMIGAISYRGPDETGVFTDREAGLAHARLSIIDVASGQQPMLNRERSFAITFNGEIFNYLELREELLGKGCVFQTSSDTEVLLRLYEIEGADCVNRLNGQWAFAIWDARQCSLFLSRDRMGVRPLYFTRTRDAFLFASEIKALLAAPGVRCELDLAGLDQVFSFWGTAPPRTVFAGIEELPPGNSMRVTARGQEMRRYWQMQYAPEIRDSEIEPHQIGKYAEDLLNLLTDATRIRLRSDVPVGSYLSGGLDSTLITALGRQMVGDSLHTYSVAFEDAAYDETRYQDEASTFLKTNHHRTLCTNQAIADSFPKVVWHAEKPLVRTAPAPLYNLARLVHENGFKVVLCGEGSDEVLGGYDIYKEAKLRRFWAAQPDSKARPLLLRRIYPYLSELQEQPDAYLQAFFKARPEDVAHPCFSHLTRWNMTAGIKRLFSDEIKAELRTTNAVADLVKELPAGFMGWHEFNQAEYLETAGLLPGYILSSQGDRMAMAHSVEMRHPFLDVRVVEFAAKLPPSLKMRVMNEKYLLKLCADGKVPHSILERPKQPYRAPEGKCFFTGRHDFVGELLSEESLRATGIFQPAGVRRLLRKFHNCQASGVRDNMALVAVLSTQILLQQFILPHNQGRRAWTVSNASCVPSS